MKREYYYFDNSATSNPKPEVVYERVNYAMRELNANPGRGGHRLAIKAATEIYAVRDKISKFFNVGNALNVAFTNNSTTALNFAVKSLVEENDIVVTTEMDHNSTLRPLYTDREKLNLDIRVLKIDDILVDLKELLEEVEKSGKKVKFLCINHMSNVTGKTLDIEKIGEICKAKGVKLIVDVSQSAGIIPIDMQKMNIDILCFTGHKSLYAIQGIGGICIKDGIKIKPLLCGGSGSYSTNLVHPTEMPEVVEGGTVNTPGIISLGAGIDFVNSVGICKIYSHENNLKLLFIRLLNEINKVSESEGNGKIIEIYSSDRVGDGPVVSLNIKGQVSSDVSQMLDEDFGIITRSGLHCAPLIHKKNNTVERGSVRFSFGYFNTEKDVKYAVDSLKMIIQG